MAGPNRPVCLLQSPVRSFDWQHFTVYCGRFVDQCPLFHHLDLVNMGDFKDSVRSQRLSRVNISISETSRFPPSEIHGMFRGMGPPRLPARYRKVVPSEFSFIESQEKISIIFLIQSSFYLYFSIYDAPPHNIKENFNIRNLYPTIILLV